MNIPTALGRGAIVSSAQDAMSGNVVHLTSAAVADPQGAVETLHEHWLSRTPVTIVLDVDPANIRTPISYSAEPYGLTPEFTPWLDRLHFLLWANNVDMRNGTAIWWWARKAERLGAAICTTGDGDILLPDGSPAWIDGGPRDAGIAEHLTIVHSESIDLGRLNVMPPPVIPTARLAPDQLAAVAHRAGPARIIAPAGSGKTRVLTERLRHLIVDRRYEPESVLALAYNRRARGEMEQRISDVGARIQTLNALGYELLREVRPGVTILDERAMRTLLEEVLPALQWRANTDPLAPYIEALATIRLGMRDPAEIEELRDDVPGIAEAFGPYRAAMQQRNAVDFDEQLYASVEALLRDGTLRRRWQQRNRHLLVDEFQDLRPLHLLFIRLLACPELDVFGVGDDDQVLYGYDGASPRFLIDFRRHFPGAAEHALTINYRCPVPIVDAARTLLGHNRVRIDKTITAASGAAAEPSTLEVRTHSEEQAASEIVNTVRGWLSAGAQPSDIAVLSRVNSTLLVPQIVLSEAGIAADSAVGPELLTRTGTRAALAYLRIGAAGERIASSDIGEILRRPSRGLPPWFTERLHRRRTWSLSGLHEQQLPDKEQSKLERLIADLSVVQRSVATGSTLDALRLIRNQIGLGGAMALLGRNGGTDRSSHLDDLDALERIAPLHDNPGTFEAWLANILGRPRDGNGVTLGTVHRVKGMEWDHVCVIGVAEGLMPHRLADDIEEERRVFHVALTRARRSAVVLAEDDRPSRFLRELHEEWVAEPEPVATDGGRDGIIAEVGMTLTATGGISGTITRVSGTGATVALGPGSNLIVRYGEQVTANGRRGRLQQGSRQREHPAPSAAAGPTDAALRQWRLERARSDGVPPYVVMHDTTLIAIAEQTPTTLVQLSRVPGIGPAKLDRYGDEILAVVAGES